jgi:hypothetical protein
MATHDELWDVCRDTQEYRSRGEKGNPLNFDCSSGCRFFHKLDGSAGFDWGVCACPASPRAGLLTFEHMGCECFMPEEGDADEEETE